MLSKLKRKMQEKIAEERAVSDSRKWKFNALLQECLQSMRGSCTVLPMELHEAVAAAVNIAMQENTWTILEELIDIPEDFFDGMVHIIWNEPLLPVLKAPWVLVDENLHHVRAVAFDTFLVSQSMDRIIWFDGLGRIKLYSIA